MPALSAAVTRTSSVSPPARPGAAFADASVTLGAVVSDIVMISESLVKLSEASPTVVRTTSLSPFLRPVTFTGTTRCVEVATGLRTAVSDPMTAGPLLIEVYSVCTPTLSVDVIVTFNGAPTSTVLLVPTERLKEMVGFSTSEGSPPPTWGVSACGPVTARVSQLATTATPSTSAANRAKCRMGFMFAPARLAPRRLRGLQTFIDDVRRDEDQQVAAGLGPRGGTEQTSNQRKIDEQRNALLGELHRGLRQPADDDGLPIGNEKLRPAAVVVDQDAVDAEGRAGVDGLHAHHDLTVVRHAGRDTEGDTSLHALDRDRTGEHRTSAAGGRDKGDLRARDQFRRTV